jgi:hypothetical protein
VLATALRSCSWCWVRTAENTKSLPSLTDLLFISSLVTSWMLRRSTARWRCRELAGSRIHDLRHAATCLVLARGLIGDSAGVDEACRNFDDERVRCAIHLLHVGAKGGGFRFTHLTVTGV